MSIIESLVSQLAEAAKTADLSVRYQLSGELQRLARSIATPRQVMQHYGHLYTEQVVARIANDLKIFSILSESDGPLKTEQVASKCGGDPALIDRILRHLASTYTIAEVGLSTFAANEVTRLLATPAGEGNLMYGFNTLNKALHALPDYLKEKEYKNPDQHHDTAYHRAFDTKEQFFHYLQNSPEIIRYFYPSLTAFKSPVSWTSVVPLAEKLKDADANAPLFVDVGGGHGYQCAAFREATREQFPGRVINQDLPGTLAEAPKYEDIEMMNQDFYQKNQIQGARIYYIRQCLHDLPDKEARVVLQQIRDAMAPHSILLIDEMVIPDTGASPFSMQLDMVMMAFLNAHERTISLWRKLLEEVGLEISQVHRYDPELEYSILEAVPMKR
ncbi:O-methyl transferase B protein [Rutstroemia sp. NJR-2017a WRK4]|nr:O-methyl transferase B protein [Rutstroemia sp. NJR-2017a WRK4]